VTLKSIDTTQLKQKSQKGYSNFFDLGTFTNVLGCLKAIAETT
jgi:hypothetical protein